MRPSLSFAVLSVIGCGAATPERPAPSAPAGFEPLARAVETTLYKEPYTGRQQVRAANCVLVLTNGVTSTTEIPLAAVATVQPMRGQRLLRIWTDKNAITITTNPPDGAPTRTYESVIAVRFGADWIHNMGAATEALRDASEVCRAHEMRRNRP